MNKAANNIEKYCGNIEERIKACRTKEAAVLLKKRMCRELREHCKSDMVHNSLKYQIDQLIDGIFNNQDLEDNHVEE
jgi:hypothetical protein